MTTPPEESGYSPAASNTDTEGALGIPGAAPMSTQQQASVTETATSAAGGSTADTAPVTQYGGALDSATAVIPPDTEGTYGGAYTGPWPWKPADTSYGTAAQPATLDTTIGGGAVRADTVPSYRAPSAGVAGMVKDTSLTDILGNQIAAQPVNNASFMNAQMIDTSYIGAPAAPAALSSQTDTFTGTATGGTRYYASQQGIITSTLAVRDTTRSTNLVAGTDYTLTTALNGPNASAYITLTAGTNYTAGDTVTLAYSYGSPQYFDSNLPPAQTLQVTDTLALSDRPVQLNAWGVTTAAASITVFDVTQNQALTYNTDYTVTQVTAPSTPGGSYPETPAVTYAISWKPTSAVAKLGDVITAAYSYTSSVPAAPGMGASVTWTDTITSFTATPVALAHTGAVTPPAALSVLDTTNGKTLVLNTDYTVTVTGSGATLAYSIARLAGSTNSTSGDHVSVTYATGNAAYFSSGPVQPVNRGVLVPWAPPSGTTEVDYYLIQSSDLGTMYVPATGQPGLYGQPSPSGGADYGQPVYQTDTFSSWATALAAPAAAPGTSTAATGGTVAAGTYKAVVTYTDANGESLPSPSASVTASGGTSTITVNSPPAQAGATGWYAYVTQVGASVYTRQQAAGSPTAIGTNLTLTAPPSSSGAQPPASDTTSAVLSKTGIVTPPQQIIVKDLTTAGKQGDPLAADALVLEYGYDYTVNVTGTGPWTSYEVVPVPSSVNSDPGDQIQVSYWYDQMGAFPLTAVADAVIASAGSAALTNKGIFTPPSGLIVYDTTISKALAYGADFTVSVSGEGPVSSYTLSLITAGPAGAGNSDHLTVYYLYGQALTAIFSQGIGANAAPIYTPAGTVRSQGPGYQFAIAAGNRAGLGPFSNWSDYASPLNYNAPQPGYAGHPGITTSVGTGGLDPANTVNPVYKPDGTVRAGTGLGA